MRLVSTVFAVAALSVTTVAAAESRTYYCGDVAPAVAGGPQSICFAAPYAPLASYGRVVFIGADGVRTPFIILDGSEKGTWDDAKFSYVFDGPQGNAGINVDYEFIPGTYIGDSGYEPKALVVSLGDVKLAVPALAWMHGEL